MRTLSAPRKHLLAAFVLAAMSMAPAANAETSWQWHYSGAGIEAAGTLLGSDAPDAAGFYDILGISGSRNGDTITGLYPTGSAIPGNAPYAVDNLIRVDGPGQITLHGFGFSLQSGAHANPYFADFLPVPAYAEVFTSGSSFSELPIAFHVTLVPEAATNAMLLAGLGVVWGVAGHRRRRIGRS